MKKSKSLKEWEQQQLLEIEKCKNDIVYFIENYVTPEIKLNDFQKEMLNDVQQGKVSILRSTRTAYKLWYISSKVRHEEFKKEN